MCFSKTGAFGTVVSHSDSAEGRTPSVAAVSLCSHPASENTEIALEVIQWRSSRGGLAPGRRQALLMRCLVPCLVLKQLPGRRSRCSASPSRVGLQKIFPPSLGCCESRCRAASDGVYPPPCSCSHRSSKVVCFAWRSCEWRLKSRECSVV